MLQNEESSKSFRSGTAQRSPGPPLSRVGRRSSRLRIIPIAHAFGFSGERDRKVGGPVPVPAETRIKAGAGLHSSDPIPLTSFWAGHREIHGAEEWGQGNQGRDEAAPSGIFMTAPLFRHHPGNRCGGRTIRRTKHERNMGQKDQRARVAEAGIIDRGLPGYTRIKAGVEPLIFAHVSVSEESPDR